MFDHCTSLRTIYVGSGWTIGVPDKQTKYNAKIAEQQVFTNCYNLIGGNGTKYGESKSSKDFCFGKMATIDYIDKDGNARFGYLTPSNLYDKNMHIYQIEYVNCANNFMQTVLVDDA